WDRLLANVLDPNTDVKVVREITLKVKVRPDDGRSFGLVGLTVTSKLAPFKGVQSAIYIDQQNGKAIASEQHHDQPRLNWPEGGD
ncbi:MAG: hypothetical protein MN733_36895, partial [Nitrososphaera sp.]|nr:hypothetical protein [Nitrososphaera sp.]